MRNASREGDWKVRTNISLETDGKGYLKKRGSAWKNGSLRSESGERSHALCGGHNSGKAHTEFLIYNHDLPSSH